MKEVGYLIETGWSASGRKRQRTKLAVWNKFSYRASVSCEPSIRPCTYWAERLQRESRTINVSHAWEKYTVGNENTKLIRSFCRLARWWVGVGRSLAAFRAEQILQGSDDGAAFFLGRRLNDTGEPCEGLRTTLILGTMGKLAHNHRRSQGPLPTVVRRFDGRVVQEQQHSPSIMLQTDSVQ